MKISQIKRVSQKGGKLFLGILIGGLFYAQDCQSMQILRLSRAARISSHSHLIPQARFYNTNGPIENSGPEVPTRQGPQLLKTEFFDGKTIFSELPSQKITISENCVEILLPSPRQLPLEKLKSEESLRAWRRIWSFEVIEIIIGKGQDPNNYNPMCYLGDDGLYRLLSEKHRQIRIQNLIYKIDSWLIIIEQINFGRFSARYKEYKMNHSLAKEIKDSLKDRLSNPDMRHLAPAIAIQRESYSLYLDSLGKGDYLDELSYQIFRIYQDAEEMLRQSSLK